MAKSVPGYSDVYVRRHVHHFPLEYSDLEGHDTEFAPVVGRGWTFQEQLLSPRIIHFCNQEVVWQCKICIRQECGRDTPLKDETPMFNNAYTYYSSLVLTFLLI